MAHPAFKAEMGHYLEEVLERLQVVYRRQVANWQVVAPSEDLDAGIDYKLELRVRNKGHESPVKNVQIRCKEPNRVRFYKDDKYQTVVERVDSPHWFTEPNAVLQPDGGTTDPLSVYFRVTNDPDSGSGQQLANIGIYAEIVPESDFWKPFTWKL